MSTNQSDSRSVTSTPSDEAEKDAAASDAGANRNQNDPANEALAALVAAMVARGDMDGATRVLAAYAASTPDPKTAPVLALVTSTAAKRG